MMSEFQGPRADQVKKMFSQVAHKYDRANTVLSAGIHHLWRKKLVQLSGARESQSVLDCATGTGDLAIEFKKVVGSNGRVVGTDFCEEMLLTAPQKAKNFGLDIEFSVADVTQLPFKEGEFDYSTISFGIRNVERPLLGLSELARVVKPGGFVLVLEFGQVQVPLFSQIYSWYSKKILPKVGGWVTGQPEAYEYLQNSSAEFPCGSKFVELMNSTKCFDQIEYFTLSAGIAYIYKARVK